MTNTSNLELYLLQKTINITWQQRKHHRAFKAKSSLVRHRVHQSFSLQPTPQAGETL